MRIPTDHPLAQTYALYDGSCSPYQVSQLVGRDDPYSLDALIETALLANNAGLAAAAIRVLAKRPQSIAHETIEAALTLPWTSARQAALRSLRASLDKVSGRCWNHVQRLLRADASRLVRADCLRLIAARTDEPRWSIFIAADDPHWRVRKELLNVLHAWGADVSERRQIEERLIERSSDLRVDGVLRYLRYRWSGRSERPSPISVPPQAFHDIDEWDWDPAVLAYRLEQLDDRRCRELIAYMPELIGQDDDRVARRAAAALSRFGELRHLVAALRWLDEPRLEAAERVRTWFEKLDLDRREAAARAILLLPVKASPESLAWAIDQAGVAFPAEEESECFETLLDHPATETVRGGLARLLSRWSKHPYSKQRRLELLPADEPAMGQFQFKTEAHPLPRADALTLERAAQLIEEPTMETSWHVLARAARLTRTPIWKIEPEQVAATPVIRQRQTLEHAEREAPPSEMRPLGANNIMVSQLGLSGHYGLPVEGFHRGVDSGVNLLFWEPNYDSLTTFARRLPAARRDALHFIVGTFEANPKRIRANVERALRMTRLEQVRFFILFWVRSWKRLTAEVYACLDSLAAEGVIGEYGLSTHSRPLAVEAMRQGWNPIMVRHSAAHRGAEDAVFPAAMDQNVGLITFNNTCYGRLLEPFDGQPSPVTAADCYRFSLANPAVSVCLTAPSTTEQLNENLSAMHSPELPPERSAKMIEHGGRLYEEERVFSELVKSV